MSIYTFMIHSYLIMRTSTCFVPHQFIYCSFGASEINFSPIIWHRITAFSIPQVDVGSLPSSIGLGSVCSITGPLRKIYMIYVSCMCLTQQVWGVVVVVSPSNDTLHLFIFLYLYKLFIHKSILYLPHFLHSVLEFISSNLDLFSSF